MNLGPNTVSGTYRYILNQSGANQITLGDNTAVNWGAAGVVMTTGTQVISGIKTFSSTLNASGNVYLGGSGANNQFGKYGDNNDFGNESSFCKFARDSEYNSFGMETLGGIVNNSFGISYFSTCVNDFGSYATNTFGSYATNTFGSYSASNSFGHDSSSNQFGANADENRFGDAAASNVFGSSANNNSFGQDGLVNNFGLSEIATQTVNNFGYQALTNAFGSQAHVNVFGESVEFEERESGVSNFFGPRASSNTFGSTTGVNSCIGTFIIQDTGRVRLANFSGLPSQTGLRGEARVSGTFLYICTGATSGWGRIQLQTFV